MEDAKIRRKTYKHWTTPPPDRCVGLSAAAETMVTQLEPGELIRVPEIIAMEPLCEHTLLTGSPIHTRPFMLSEMTNARVFSHHGVVIDSANQLITDLTHEFNDYPMGNRVCHYEGLPPVEKIDATVLLLPSISGWKNYYHWIIESLPRLRNMEQQLQATDYILTPLSRPYHTQWLDQLGIPAEKRLEAKFDTHIQVRKLIAPSPPEPMVNSLSAITWLRQQIPDLPTTAHRKIYVTRADSWRRRARNESALIEQLRNDHGYELISLSGMHALDQARLFASAKEIIAPHGAALANLAFAQPGAKLLELFLSDFIYPQYYRLAALTDVRYAGHSSYSGPEDPDYSIDYATLRPVLDAFLRA